MTRDFSIPDTLRLTASLLSRDSGLLPPVGAAWFGAVVILTAVVQSGMPFGASVVSLLVGSFFSALLTYAAVGRYTPSLNEAVSVASQAYLSVLVVSVISFVAAMIGLVFLIIPGVAVMVLFALVVPIVMAERPGIIATFRRSFDLVWPAVLPILGFIVIIAIPAFIAIALGSAFIDAIIPGMTGLAVSGGLQAAAGGIISIYASAAVYLTLTGGQRADVAGTFD
ncbi:MAG: hypothetical protein AAFW65_07910 [Pseudomonadota bacterium]